MLRGTVIESGGRFVFCSTHRYAKSAAECHSFSDSASVLQKKVLDICDHIAALCSTAPDQLMFDLQHTSATLNDITLITQDKVEAILALISGKSSPLYFVPTSLLKSASECFHDSSQDSRICRLAKFPEV